MAGRTAAGEERHPVPEQSGRDGARGGRTDGPRPRSSAAAPAPSPPRASTRHPVPGEARTRAQRRPAPPRGTIGPGRPGGRARWRRLYLLRATRRRRPRARRGPGLRGAGSGSRAAGRAPRRLPPSTGSRWSGRSRWSVAWSVPQRGPGPERPGTPGPLLTLAPEVSARASRTPTPPPSCSEAPRGPRDAVARGAGKGCPKCACLQMPAPSGRWRARGPRSRAGEALGRA